MPRSRASARKASATSASSRAAPTTNGNIRTSLASTAPPQQQPHLTIAPRPVIPPSPHTAGGALLPRGVAAMRGGGGGGVRGLQPAPYVNLSSIRANAPCSLMTSQYIINNTAKSAGMNRSTATHNRSSRCSSSNTSIKTVERDNYIDSSDDDDDDNMGFGRVVRSDSDDDDMLDDDDDDHLIGSGDDPVDLGDMRAYASKTGTSVAHCDVGGGRPPSHGVSWSPTPGGAAGGKPGLSAPPHSATPLYAGRGGGVPCGMMSPRLVINGPAGTAAGFGAPVDCVNRLKRPLVAGDGTPLSDDRHRPGSSVVMAPTGGPIRKIVRRVFTNTRERWRQQNVNGAFAELRKLVPTHPPDKKLSKNEILRLTIKYIALLDRVLQYQKEQSGETSDGGKTAYEPNNNVDKQHRRRQHKDQDVSRRCDVTTTTPMASPVSSLYSDSTDDGASAVM